jgi:hypothetical protein
MTVKQRLTAEDIQSYTSDQGFYSLLIQAGYLTWEPTDTQGNYGIRLANRELVHVWREFILERVYRVTPSEVTEALSVVAEPGHFVAEFTRPITNRLSYFDFDAAEPERTYHAFVAGMLAGTGIRFASNRESGYGRYDIMALMADETIIFEFKLAAFPDELEAAADIAIAQIVERDYAADVPKADPSMPST